MDTTSQSKQEISNWFDQGKQKGALFMLLTCDAFDNSDFRPVFIENSDDFWVQYQLYNNPNSLAQVVEIYDLTQPKDEQLDEIRAWRAPPREGAQ